MSLINTKIKNKLIRNGILVVMLLIVSFLTSCTSGIEESSKEFSFNENISFSENTDGVVEIDFENSHKSIKEKYDMLFQQLNSLSDKTNIAVASTSTANMFYEVGFLPKGTPESSSLNKDITSKQYKSGENIIPDGTLSIGGVLNPNVEAIVNSGVEMVLLSDAMPHSKWIESLEELGVPVETIYQSDYTDMFVILQVLRELQIADSNLINNKMLSMKNDLEEISTMIGDKNNQTTVALIQFMPGAMYVDGSKSVLGSLVEELNVKNIFSESASVELNEEDLLIKDPELIIVYGKSNDTETLKKMFLDTFNDQASALSSLKAVKNQNYLFLGSDSFEFVGSIDFNVTKLMKQIAEAMYDKKN